MNLEFFKARFAKNAEGICHLVEGVPPDQARWKPAPDEWSILEVINHLDDEEREDFRTRLDLLLHHPGQPWPPIDPPGWVIERNYNERELIPSLSNFLQARRESLIWLDTLVEPNWNAIYQHPAAGPLSAGDLLSSWLAHDFLHLRQLSHLHWAYLADMVQPYNPQYAGPW